MKDNQYNRLRVVLAEKNLTGKWLYEQLGVSKVTMSRWVNNRTQPPLEQLYKIANVLDIEVSELLRSNKVTEK